ncbi:MAG TPA: chloride channel protein [Aquabacterium sp.]|uniref:chloride channel protein n=1 Tax=Aquabacterium sp. TaxID=1872578 RepID=UPI002E34FB3F|nr:chloride channel protein [Aquabacterium sp.]HEX5374390.1 chloride channel protein [Aquabacterium sp.]
MSESHDDLTSNLGRELSDWRRWVARLVVLGFAALAGLSVAGFTWLSELALGLFRDTRQGSWWWPLIWTPALTAGIVWITRRWFEGAAGSGIPQVLAALDSRTPREQRHLFVSLRLSLAKLILTTGGLLAGLSSGREGPSVQIAAGVLHHARRWLPERTRINEHGLMAAGGAAGVAAAFNTPLGGVMFAIEQLARQPEERTSGLLIAAIVLAGLIAVSIHGNGAYFGRIHIDHVTWDLWWPGLAVTLASGALGGLFARLLVQSMGGLGTDRFSLWRQQHPVRFAGGCGLAVALIGLVSQGDTFGSGYQTTRSLLEGEDQTSELYVVLRMAATWLSAWSGVPGGVFAPALAIGAGLGNHIAQWTGHPGATALIALGMAGFLAAVTRAPITSFIIVMEMIEGHTLVLSLMACTMVANTVSRLISPSLYDELARIQGARCRASTT